MSNNPPSPSGNGSKICLIIMQALQGLTLMPWVFMSMMAVMVFDAPGSTSLWQPWAFAIAIWSYPVWLGLAAVLSWVLFSKGWRAAALWVAFVFLLPFPAFFLFVFLS